MTALQTTSRKPRGTRWQFYLAGLLVVAFLTYFFQPGVAAWWLRRHLVARALESNATVSFTKVEADFIGGHILLEGVQLADRGNAANLVRSAEIQIDLSLWRMLFQRELSPVKKLAVGKTSIDWKWAPAKAAKATKKGKSESGARQEFRNRFPDAFVGNGISGNLECGHAKVGFGNVDFSFLPGVAGEIDIPHLSASLPPWNRMFNNLEGTTAIKGRGLYVGGLKFTPDLVLERGAIDFTQPDKQKITSDLLFSAFGGQWRTDIDLERRKSPLEIDLAASFWNLSVRKLGEFVGNRDLAEGTIHEGRVTFQGDPAEPARAKSTLRLNATDFRWHQRQWNSLVASALLVNHRIEIPQFDLVQDKNQIQLKGNADLPAKWFQIPAEFQFQVLAQIDDLDSAALLLLPGQQLVGGEAFFAGEIRNQQGQFSGNLKMRGGPLQVSGVSIDRFRGDLDLQGSEVRATALEFARHDDKAAGWATLDLAEPRRYSAEFEITARDIADYRAILPKAVAERAAAGGVNLWWSGDGSEHAHSGAFKMSLKDFLVSRAKNAVPLDVESHGSYSPAGITFNQIKLSRPNTKLSAALVVRPDSMELRDLRIAGSGGSTVTGNITLPVNLFEALSNPTLASLLDSHAAASGEISGNNVRLDELGELAGLRPPVRGRARFDFTASGPIDSLEARLEIGLTDFVGPENFSLPALASTLQLSGGRLNWQGQINPDEVRDGLSFAVQAQTTLSRVSLVQGQWLDSAAPFGGTLALKRFDLTQLRPWWPSIRPFGGDASGDLTLAGTSARPVFTGSLLLQNTSWQPDWLLEPLQKLNGTLRLSETELASEKITGAYRGGTFSVGGKAGFSPSDFLDLQIEGKNLTLSSQSDPSEAVVEGSVHLLGAAVSRTIEGVVRIQNAVLWRELTLESPAVDLPPVAQFSLPWVPLDWQVKLEVTAPEPFEIRSREQRWLVQPQIVFSGPARSPVLMGKLAVRPLTLTRDATTENASIAVYFNDTPLENGEVNVTRSSLDAELPKPSVMEPLVPATPTATPESISLPRRLQIAPRVPENTSNPAPLNVSPAGPS